MLAGGASQSQAMAGFGVPGVLPGMRPVPGMLPGVIPGMVPGMVPAVPPGGVIPVLPGMDPVALAAALNAGTVDPSALAALAAQQAGIPAAPPLPPESNQPLTAAQEWEKTKNDTRIAEDGELYTKAEFVAHYGSLKEWDSAAPDLNSPNVEAAVHASELKGSSIPSDNGGNQGKMVESLPSWANEGDWRCPDPK